MKENKKVTPVDLKNQINAVPVSFEYDWQKQSLKDSCKAGTAMGTGTNGGMTIGGEDWNMD